MCCPDVKPVPKSRWLLARAARVSALALGLFFAQGVFGQEAPHNFDCADCHTSHYLFGNQMDAPFGNANACLACHQVGGTASAKPLHEADQAFPWAGVTTNGMPHGTSHAWDVNPGGRVKALGAAPAYAVVPLGTYSGSYPATYTITITAAGSVGSARFDWQSTAPSNGRGTNLLVSSVTAVDQGLTLMFFNYRPGPAFQPGDSWQISVHPDITYPSNQDMQWLMPWNNLVCSTCHDQHSEARTPFDPNAPASGPGRHFLRADNNQDQLCAECHGARFVTNAIAGSHPVGILVSSNASYHPPTLLPLDKTEGKMWCSTCHQPHNSPANDGNLLRVASETELCGQCHASVDIAKPASHLNQISGPLWPGGQFGSQFPADADRTHRGACGNCHRVHGWPDGSAPTNDYPSLLVEREENLCNTCHDGGPAAKNITAQFTKTYKHPVALSGRHTATEDGTPANYGNANRHSECADCHNVHKLTPDAVPPTAPFASTSLAGVARVSVNNISMNQITFTYRPASDPAPVKEYELCFTCHSSWTTQPAGQGDFAKDFNDQNMSFHPVEGIGKNTNIDPNSFTNGWTASSTMFCTDCHTSDDPTVRGPHGSTNQFILKKKAVASTTRRASGATMPATELCFDCHKFDTYANSSSSTTVRNYSRFSGGNGHAYHVVSQRYSCYNCHETHGTPSQANLLVTGRSPGINTYTRTVNGGTCAPTCHGSESYTVAYPR